MYTVARPKRKNTTISCKSLAHLQTLQNQSDTFHPVACGSDAKKKHRQPRSPYG